MDNGTDKFYGYFKKLILEGIGILANYELAEKGKGVLTLGEVKEDFIDWKMKFYLTLKDDSDLIKILTNN